MKAAALVPLLATLLPASSAFLGKAKDPLVYKTVIDDFKGDFTVGEAESKWNYFAFGPYIGNDGVASTSRPHGGRVTVNTEPAFTLTAPPDGAVPGDIEHVKWLVFANATSSAGYPGYDTNEGYVTSCEAQVGGQLFATASQPFGPDVDANNPSLGWVGAVTGDFETFMIFDFALTNDAIYALYERLPFGRSETNNYASFTALARVASRGPGDMHALKVSYDRSARTVSWLIGGHEVYRINRVGYYPPDRADVLIDRGGDEIEVSEMRQLVCGFGTFTLMDGYVPALGKGLVRLNPQDPYYLNPSTGEPLEFVDNASTEANRLFGQGAELVVTSVSVSSAKSRGKPGKGGPASGVRAEGEL